MPSFSEYKKILGSKTIGQAHKDDSDMVIEATWYSDINAKTAYFYDQEHDTDFDKFYYRNPSGIEKIPVDVKLFEVEYNSLSKDEQPLHLQFKPSYECNIPYYKGKFERLTGAQFPVGLYFDYQDSKGIYRRYLVVDEYRDHANQFPTYLALPCNFKAQWVYQGKKYESWCVRRSQNSYNSGLWTDNVFTNPENQTVLWFSFNDKTKTVFYDQRIAISQLRDVPVCWKCSKVEDMAVHGIIRTTWAQDQWNEHTDYIEMVIDENGEQIARGIWCDYFKEGVIPVEPDAPKLPEIHSVITYKGKQDNQIKVGGSGRKFVVTFYDNDEQVVEFQPGNWTVWMDGEDKTDLFVLSPTSEENQVSIKANDDDSLIGKIITIKYVSESEITSQIDMNLIGL
jgi:hypothetical protein